MTELVVKLPDELAQRARSAGLLSDSAIARLLEEAMRREAGRKLLAVAGQRACVRHRADDGRGNRRRSQGGACRAERTQGWPARAAVTVVLDTNVVVSALLWGDTPYRLLQAATEGEIELYTSPALLAELATMLARRHLAPRPQAQHSSVEQALGLMRSSPSACRRSRPRVSCHAMSMTIR